MLMSWLLKSIQRLYDYPHIQFCVSYTIFQVLKMKSTPFLLTGAKPIHLKMYFDCFWSSCRAPEISNKHQKYICKSPKNLRQLSLKPLTRKLAPLFFADVHFNSRDANLTKRKQAQWTKWHSLCTPQISSMVSECVHSPVTCATTAWEILLFPRNALISSFTMLLSLLQTHPAQVRTQKYSCSLQEPCGILYKDHFKEAPILYGLSALRQNLIGRQQKGMYWR